MKLAKTFSVAAMILLTTIVLDIMSFLYSQSEVSYTASADELKFLPQMGLVVVLAVLLGITVWMMLVWDAGDKIPPALMLLLGLSGVCIILFRFSNGVFVMNFLDCIPFLTSRQVVETSSVFLYFLMYYSTGFVSLLYIAFGVAGFFTKRKPG
jgi:hypothetical protein